MVLPVARTRDEAQLYMDLHPCDACGSTNISWRSALTSDEGKPARRYSGTCEGCETEREFVFELPEKPVLPPEGAVVVFGGPEGEPSTLLDAGEWLSVADLAARSAHTTDAGGRTVLRDDASRRALAIALAAIDEVVKFIPQHRDAVPWSAFWTDRGREVRADEPGRFRRERLRVVRDTYRDILDGVEAS